MTGHFTICHHHTRPRCKQTFHGSRLQLSLHAMTILIQSVFASHCHHGGNVFSHREQNKRLNSIPLDNGIRFTSFKRGITGKVTFAKVWNGVATVTCVKKNRKLVTDSSQPMRMHDALVGLKTMSIQTFHRVWDLGNVTCSSATKVPPPWYASEVNSYYKRIWCSVSCILLHAWLGILTHAF